MNFDSVVNPFAGKPILYREVIDSTMREADELAAQGYGHGTVVVAGYQTGGRGRLPGRTWVCPPEQGLTFTVILDRTAVGRNARVVPLLAALALSRVLDHHLGIPVRIKWPNDVLVNRKKIAGILCEERNTAVTLGMGVNVRSASVPPGLEDSATCIESEIGIASTGSPADARLPAFAELVELLLNELRGTLGDVRWRTAIRELLYGRGRSATISVEPAGSAGASTFSGLVEGIDEEGRIVLRDSVTGTARAFAGGELRFDAGGNCG